MTTNNEYDDLEEIELSESDKPSFENNSNNEENQTGNSILREFLSYMKIIVIAISIAFICNQFIIVNAKVPTGSMKDTIMEGNRLIGFRLSYLFSDPKRLDVVIFKFPDNESENYVKRIIGLPGDNVVIKEGHVYVNDVLLDEPYIKEPMSVSSQVLNYAVPAGCYFMMGDNRNNSADSRFWVNTYVAKDKILAKAIFKYYDSHIVFELIK
ncbi:signal peptidase I [[Clostridium] fimetarium]|uniref:Signal peptidase I n=1 Tax=[Clostridium] fimetarium TaxID=99656 RepID=A0A1I0MR87_9FIRM|nr:signal peptidase I [[Clostridium] fimetarium]SEV91101.1 signal peptidase I [[Clostridium] fimetarium]